MISQFHGAENNNFQIVLYPQIIQKVLIRSIPLAVTWNYIRVVFDDERNGILTFFSY